MNQRNEPMARFFWSVLFKRLYFLSVVKMLFLRQSISLAFIPVLFIASILVLTDHRIRRSSVSLALMKL